MGKLKIQGGKKKIYLYVSNSLKKIYFNLELFWLLIVQIFRGKLSILVSEHADRSINTASQANFFAQKWTLSVKINWFPK